MEKHITLLRKRRKIVVILIIFFLVLMTLTAAKLMSSYYSTYRNVLSAIANTNIGIAQDISSEMDKQVYKRFLENKTKDEDYDKIYQFLSDYREKTNTLYVYTLLLDGTPTSKVMIAAKPQEIADIPIGVPCTLPERQERDVQAGKTYYTDIIKDKDYGKYLSVGAPIYDESGQFLGALGIDISSEAFDQIGKQVIKENIFLLIIDLSLDLMIIIAVYYLRSWYKARLQKDIKETEQFYIKELSQLINSFKANRHDLMNHFQVISGLLSFNQNDKARDYLNSLIQETKLINLSLKFNNPALLALFNSKWEITNMKNIEMVFEVDQDDFDKIISTDLVKIFSNLIDNAIDACEQLPQDSRYIRVVCRVTGQKYVFVIENSALLTPKDVKRLFDYGYTTKFPNKQDGKLERGQGLQIVQQVIEKYDGDVYHHYLDNKLMIQITLKAG